MVKISHTPGPWRAVRFRVLSGEREVADTSEITATLYNGTQEEGIANAYLIAAAPDMLTALRIAAINTKHNRLDTANPSGGCWTTCAACVIEAAIVKALPIEGC